MGIMIGLILCLQDPATMSPDTWVTVPDSKMRSVAPTNGQFAGTWGVGGPGMVIAAWGGGALDTQRSRLILWGGGHADYYGNEVYAFDIPTLKWSRLTDPFVSPVMDQETNADGTPNSRHTYSGLAYIAHADKFFGQGGSLAGVGFAKCDKSWTFDFATKKWKDQAPATTPGGGFGVTCAYDPASKKLYWGGGSGFWSYTYDTNTWTKLNDDGFYYNTSAIDSKRGQLLVIGNGSFFSYDLKNGNYVKQNWPTTGAASVAAAGNPGFDYDPTADRFVAWAGGAPYILDPATKTWTTGSATGAAGAGSNGIYGRWRYVPTVNAFVVVTGADDNVYFYKASASAGTPAPTPPASTPSPAPSPSPAPQQSSSNGDGSGDSGKCGCGAVDAPQLDWLSLVALATAGLLLRL